MIDGYVTYDELKLITGFNKDFLDDLIFYGIRTHYINIYNTQTVTLKSIKNGLYNLKEVEEWVKVHL